MVEGYRCCPDSDQGPEDIRTEREDIYTHMRSHRNAETLLLYA